MAQPPSGQQPYLASPPELPAIPDLNARLADYLRTLALWCQGNFNSTLQKRSSTGELFMHSTTGKTVWKITVNDSGVLATTQLTPGKGPQ